MYTVKQARMLKGKTQAEMADCLGVCRDTYRAIEQNPDRATVKQAKAISAFLGLEIRENPGTRMKPGVPAHGASQFTTHLPLLQRQDGP